MLRPIKVLLLFEIGLLAGIYIVSPKINSKVLPISSHLPDISFPNEGNSTLTMIFTGDVMLGRSVNNRIQRLADPTWPFKNIAPILQEVDISVINLESPFVSDCQPTDTGIIFCADPKSVFGLVYAGVDFATLANNHSGNYGQKGLEETISVLNTNSITPIIQGKTVFNTVKNTKIALIAFSDFPQLDENITSAQISEATLSAEIVITTFHWGWEYQNKPNDRQVFLGHLAVDSGADIVVGHHPHWIQTEETYLGKPIYYSLGNLVFDQMWSDETRTGQILRVTYEDKILIKKEIIPIKIFDYGQPAIL